MAQHDRKKIAILGGGAGALAAAFYLTQRPEDRAKCDVTIYQMGWRLGGKGASGRNPHVAQRIEEHGVHVFLGFYENAFRLMRECYEQLGRAPDQPLSTALGGKNPAFKPHDVVTVMDQIEGDWTPWHIKFRHVPGEDPGDPGRQRRTPQPWSHLKRLIDSLAKHYERQKSDFTPEERADEVKDVKLPKHVKATLKQSRTEIDPQLIQSESLLKVAARLNKSATPNRKQRCRRLKTILWLLSRFHDTLDATLDLSGQHVVDRRRFRILLRLGMAVAIGMLKDKVVLYGYDVIDKYDFTEWLQRNGATDKRIWWSPLVRAVYALVFGYEPSDVTRPNLAAGVALRGVLRMFLMYRGAFMYKMQAGMGDAIFAPLYQVLKRRGVKFKFFHRVEKLHFDRRSNTVDRIVVKRQVTLKGDKYHPLVTVRDLPCWPSEPLYDQIDDEQANRLKRIHDEHGLNLESAWIPWNDPGTITLRAGEDYDLVVLGISIGALPHVGKELIAAKRKWKKMVKHVKTIQTQAFQFWIKRTPAELGFHGPTWDADDSPEYRERNAEPMTGASQRPIDSWIGMSQVIDREELPDDLVKHIAYFFNTVNDAENIPDPFSDPEFPITMLQNVKDEALAFTRQQFKHLWPRAVDPNDPSAFDWNLLVDLAQREGQDRLWAQYFRVNINPTDRYVLSPKGSTRHRLKPDESGIKNVYLAGDWTYTGLNAGSAESAVMSGMQAARGICGFPSHVFGENDIFMDISPLCGCIARCRGVRNLSGATAKTK